LSPQTKTRAGREGLRQKLLAWYRREQRDLPWRRTRDPWAILVSEAMLQQTRVETVLAYYDRFLERFPDPASMARADEEEVLAAWSGLGYYRRARSLHAAAQRMDGRVPDTLPTLRALPGIGRYTAGAVLSIAFDQSQPLVDGNVERVFARLFGLDHPSGSSVLVRECWKLAEELLPERAAGEWNQALMELGAVTCTPRAPACDRCPWRASCTAARTGRQLELPVPRARASTFEVEVEILCASSGKGWLLERRPEEGRMAGMWQFPSREKRTAEGPARLFPRRLTAGGPRAPGAAAVLGELRHTITRHRVRARLLVAEPPSRPATPPYRWVSADQVDGLALTGMARKAWRILRSRV
jgi:A/G-specific adenine glycosylase